MKSKKILSVSSIILLVFSLVTSCEPLGPSELNDDQLLDGTIDDLTGAENHRHLVGAAEFDKVYLPETGLGSTFVSNSCISCHAGDGKGHPFTTLTRFGQTGPEGNKMLHLGAPQLQNRAILGFTPEQLPTGAFPSKFTPPMNVGLGFLELVSDADLLAMADPDDVNGDGISGVPNWNHIPAYAIPKENAVVRNGKYICRFGKKAGVYDLLQQTANAFNQDMGISSSYESQDTYTHKPTDAEVSNSAVEDIVFYMQTLRAPIPRTPKEPQIVAGKQVFNTIGCQDCHKETLKTSYSRLAALSHREFHPYTDLLLHDMGKALDDNYTEGSALTGEWRTPPLWGLGLSPNSQGGDYFLMHDGRARSIEQAIELHGGESANSQHKYKQLSAQDKSNLILFLKSL